MSSFAPGRVDQIGVPGALRELLRRVKILEAVVPPTGGSGIQFGGPGPIYGPDNSGEYLHVTTTGVDAGSMGMVFTDTGGGGINFEVSGDGGGFYGVNMHVNDNETGAASSEPFGIDATSVDGDSNGSQISAVTSGAGSAFGETAIGYASDASGGGFGVGVTGTGITSGSGEAIGGSFSGQAHLSGDSFGVTASAGLIISNVGVGTGTPTAVRASARPNSGGVGYPIRGYAYHLVAGVLTERLVFQINQDGSLHGLTGQSLVFDL